MFINKIHELNEGEKPYFNNRYTDKKKLLKSTINITATISKVKPNKIYLKLIIDISYDLEKEKINIIKADYWRYVDIDLHEDEQQNKENYFIPFFSMVVDTLSEIGKRLINEIPPEIYSISLPLMDGNDIETQARAIYEEILKQALKQ